MFGNKDFSIEAYPINKKYDYCKSLHKFIKQYGEPDCMIYDGSKQWNDKNIEFQHIINKYDITTRIFEKERSNQNPSEGAIRELRRKWYRAMFKFGCQ